MKLYKCISFTNKYWDFIGKEQKVRFATIPELLNGNDKEEFDHRWDTGSYFFNHSFSQIKEIYENMCKNAVILCMSKSPNRSSWEHYCSKGGIRYEFEYDKSKCQDVSNNDVIYASEKIYNLPKYLGKIEKSAKVRRLLRIPRTLVKPELLVLHQWINSGTAQQNTVDHLTKELAFKKTTAFSFEDEYRFIHLLKRVSAPLKVVLEDQKTSLESIGLTLVGISTNDIEQVKQKLPDIGCSISEIKFHD